MNEGQYDSKNVEHISIENIEVVSNGMDWKSRHLEAEKRKAEIRDRIHKQTEQGQKSAKDYFRPAKPTPSIYDSDLKRVAVYARVSTSSEEQIWIQRVDVFSFKVHANGMCRVHGFQCCDLRHTIRKISRKPRNAGADNQIHLLVFGISHHSLKRIPFPQ